MKTVVLKVRVVNNFDSGQCRLKPICKESQKFVPQARHKHVSVSRVFKEFPSDSILEITVKQVKEGKA